MKTWLPLTGPTVAALSKFDNFMQQYMQENEAQGGVLAVVKDGRLVFSRGYTYDEPDGSIIQPTSIFRIASCSKVITNVAIQQLIQEGLLNLQDKVEDIILPYILQKTSHDWPGASGVLPRDPKPSDPNTPGHYFYEVTISELLSHLGGWMHNSEPVSKDVDVATSISKQLPISKYDAARYGINQPQAFWPGIDVSGDHYSNFGYSLLGLVIEAKRNMSYESAVLQYVFAPLGVDRPRIASSNKADRLPGEVYYYDGAGRTGLSVMQPDRPTVEYPYGFENFANFDSFGGWVLAAPDYAKFLAVINAPNSSILKQSIFNLPEVDTRACKPGVSARWHGGVFEGSGSYICSRTDGISLVAIWNKNTAWDISYNGKILHYDDVLNELLNDVPVNSWPANDLFNTEFGLSRWHGWFGLGGAIIESPSVTVVHPRFYDIYACGTDGRLWQKWWDGKKWNPSDTGWIAHDDGGFLLGSAPCAISEGDSFRDVYVRGRDGGVYHKTWDGKKWSNWFGLGGAMVGAPAAVVVHPTFHDIYVQGTDGRLWQKWWDGTKWNPSDTGWISHDDGSFLLGSAPCVISEGDSFRDVYVRGRDGDVYHKTWDGKKWSNWFGLGGAAVDSPAAVVVHPTFHDIYVQGTDGRLWQKWWDGKKWNPSDTGWIAHDGGGFLLGSAPCVVSDGDSFRDVYVRGRDGSVYHKYWNG